MLHRALSLAASKRAIGYGGGCPSGQSATAAATSISTITNNNYYMPNNYRSIFTSPPLLQSLPSSSDDTDSDNANTNNTKYQDKTEMIQRWMKWNQNKVWRYEPNHELIAKIGKEGSLPSPLNEFRDTVPVEKREAEIVGRSWSAKELRRKSYDDLHKLWYVLYKEKNMLLTETNLARRHGYDMVQPERRQKVRKSMGAIKHVLGERKRKKINDHKAYLAELERLDGLMAEIKLESDAMEDAMDKEAEKSSSTDKAMEGL